MARRKKVTTTAVIIAPKRELSTHDEAAYLEEQLCKAHRGLAESVHKLQVISRRMNEIQNPSENFCRAGIAVYAMLGIFDAAMKQFRFVLGMFKAGNNYDRNNNKRLLK